MKNENGKLKFTVYRKPSNTGKYLDYNSYNSKNQKISVINSLVTRAFKICSTAYLEDELDTIKRELIQNNYPKKEINKVINKKRSSYRTRNNWKREKIATTRYIVASYIRVTSERV